ncbi:MAG: hypothetical protein RIF32_03595 [Leptospirales bacterium]|jgi:hypothetical protein
MSKRLNAYAAQVIATLEKRQVGDLENHLFKNLRSESETVFCETYEHLSDDKPVEEHTHLLRQIAGQVENVWAVEYDLVSTLKAYLKAVRETAESGHQQQPSGDENARTD